jgi:hypothetical protein
MKKIIIALSVLFMALTVNAQEVIWKLTYDVGIPFSSTKEFTDQVSWRGLSLDFDRFVGDNLAVGLGFAWSTFVEKEADSDYQLENILLHGTQVRYINDIPLTARFSWYQPLSSMELYATLGAGAAWQELRREIGTWAFVGSYWQFVMIPEVGIIYPLGSSYLNARVKYVQAFEGSEAPGLSYLSIGVGFAW